MHWYFSTKICVFMFIWIVLVKGGLFEVLTIDLKKIRKTAPILFFRLKFGDAEFRPAPESVGINLRLVIGWSIVCYNVNGFRYEVTLSNSILQKTGWHLIASPTESWNYFEWLWWRTIRQLPVCIDLKNRVYSIYTWWNSRKCWSLNTWSL